MLKDAESETKSFDPMPDGTYDLVVEKAEHRTSAKGKDGYNITAVVENGPYKNRKVFETFWISPDSPAALGIFFRQMRDLGLDNSFWASDPSNEQIVAALKGRRFQGTVNTEEYNGKKNNRIQGVAKARGGPAVSDTSVPNVSEVESAVASTPKVEDKPVVEDSTPSVSNDSPWAGATTPTSDGGVPSFGGAPSAPF